MIILTNQNQAATYISICIAHCGTLAALPILVAWVTNNVGGHTKRAVAVSFATAVVQIGGVLVPQIYGEIDKPTYRQGYVIVSILLGCTLIVTCILRFCLAKENHRRDHLSNEDYDREVAGRTCDRHPDVRYMI
ncbi:unnamed protein product [Rotaria sordida]|uniref:Uncharacterized protein n=1 Tax=Rotaria sordida TaxID=392033 RepID=A0A814VV89_9BILA|nr:unnamed protein product [Rotaria sordida]